MRSSNTCDMYMCRLRYINDSVLSSLKMEGIRFFFLYNVGQNWPDNPTSTPHQTERHVMACCGLTRETSSSEISIKSTKMKPSLKGTNWGGRILNHVTHEDTCSQNSLLLYGPTFADREPKLSYVNANIAVLFQQTETCRNHILCC
jgi:hypothetical protein